jgi:hypothetical protein
MMHEPETSDLSTVAMKLANNFEGSEAESVERREGAEGNTIENRTHRTQSRASVYSGLERVRERARTEKKGRDGSPLCCTTWMQISCFFSSCAIERGAQIGARYLNPLG